MASYSLSTDSNQEAGVTAARAAYNAAVAEEDQLATNADYMQMVWDRATESYQKQHSVGLYG